MQLYKKKVIFYFFVFPVSENIVFYRRENTPLMTVAHPTGCFPLLFFSNGTLTLFRNLCMSMCPGEGGLGPQPPAVGKLHSYQAVSFSVSVEPGSGP